jgi:hypothetical protein
MAIVRRDKPDRWSMAATGKMIQLADETGATNRRFFLIDPNGEIPTESLRNGEVKYGYWITTLGGSLVAPCDAKGAGQGPRAVAHHRGTS